MHLTKPSVLITWKLPYSCFDGDYPVDWMRYLKREKKVAI